MKKLLIVILVIAILAGVGYFAYTKGLINLSFLNKGNSEQALENIIINNNVPDVAENKPTKADSDLPIHGNCLDTAKTQTELNTCSYSLYEKSEKELKSIVEKVTSNLQNMQNEAPEIFGTEYVSTFKKSQAGWEEYKNNKCGLVYMNATGGSIGPLSSNICLTSMNEARIKELDQDYINKEEGSIN